MDSEFLTVGEVAEKLRVTPMTVYRLIHSGALKAVQVGRSYRVRVESLSAYLESRTTGGE